MSYEDQLIREATEGPSFQEVHEDYLEPEPEETNDSNETGDQQGETVNAIPSYVRVALLVVLNHVEPGWENCVYVLRQWIKTTK